MSIKVVEGTRRPDPNSRRTVPVFALTDGPTVIETYETRAEADAALVEYRQRNRRGPRQHAPGAFDELLDKIANGARRDRP